MIISHHEAFATLLVNRTSVYGLIEIHDATYSIEFTEIEHVHWLYEKNIPCTLIRLFSFV